MCSKVLQPGSLVVVFETLLSSAATTVDEEKGNPSWQACADFYVACILSCLPWGGAELAEVMYILVLVWLFAEVGWHDFLLVLILYLLLVLLLLLFVIFLYKMDIYFLFAYYLYQQVFSGSLGRSYNLLLVLLVFSLLFGMWNRNSNNLLSFNLGVDFINCLGSIGCSEVQIWSSISDSLVVGCNYFVGIMLALFLFQLYWILMFISLGSIIIYQLW